MASIGINSSVDLGSAANTDTNAQILMSGFATYTAGVNEEVYELGITIGVSIGDGTGVEIGVYDVTNGAASAPLVASGVISSLVADSENVVSITPVALTQNNVYAVAARCISATAVSFLRTYEANACRQSTLTGTAALPANWSDASALNQRYAIFANVQTAAATDTTAPTLSSPTSSAVTNTSATLGATTDEAGTAHAVVYLSSEATAPTAQEIIDGTYASSIAVPVDVSVAAAGAFTFGEVTGLIGNTAYNYDIVVVDAAGNQSAILTGTFTTQSATMSITITGLASVNNVPFKLMSGTFADSNSILVNSTFNVDANGSAVIDLNGVSITEGQILEGMAVAPVSRVPIPFKGIVVIA